MRPEGPDVDFRMSADTYTCSAERTAVPARETAGYSAGVSRRLDGKLCGRLSDKVKKISVVVKSKMAQQK